MLLLRAFLDVSEPRAARAGDEKGICHRNHLSDGCSGLGERFPLLVLSKSYFSIPVECLLETQLLLWLFRQMFHDVSGTSTQATL